LGIGPHSSSAQFTWVISAEGVGSAMESGGSMAGKRNGDSGQQQSDDGDHSIHGVHDGGTGPTDNGRLSLRRSSAQARTERLYTCRLTTAGEPGEGTHASNDWVGGRVPATTPAARAPRKERRPNSRRRRRRIVHCQCFRRRHAPAVAAGRDA